MRKIQISEGRLRRMIRGCVMEAFSMRDPDAGYGMAQYDIDDFEYDDDDDYEDYDGDERSLDMVSDWDAAEAERADESLRRVIREGVRSVLMEKSKPSGTRGKREFRKEDVPGNNSGRYKKVTYYRPGKDYHKKQGLGGETMYKVGQVQARPSVAGRQNAGTNLEGGFAEREGYVENGDSMIVRNPRGEEYQVPKGEFDRKYTLAPGGQPDAEGWQTYNAFDKRQISGAVKHNLVKDMPNWGPGQKQFARKGDAHFVNPDSDDTYFIGDKELGDTHTANPYMAR